MGVGHRCRGRVPAGGWTHASLPPPSPPRAARVRYRLRRLQRAREPVAPPRDARLVLHGRPCNLVGRRGRDGGRGTRAAAVLRGPALHRRRCPRGRHPVIPPTPSEETPDMSAGTRLYARRWQALAVLSMSLLVVMIGNTILNVALPTIQKQLDASSTDLQWIVDGYLLVFAGLLLAAGTLGDRFGRKRALMSGLVVFGLGSICAMLADSSSTLIASRALMGLGAAGIMPTTLSILTNIFPEDERPKAIAAWAAVSGLGIAIGPTSGGWLIQHFDYSSIFLLNLPIVVLSLIGAWFLVPESRDPASPRLDVRGCLLSIAGLGAIVWALIEAPERGW